MGKSGNIVDFGNSPLTVQYYQRPQKNFIIDTNTSDVIAASSAASALKQDKTSMTKPDAPKPPMSAYLVPTEGGDLDRIKSLKFILGKISGTSDPKCNAAYMVALQEINSGRLDG